MDLSKSKDLYNHKVNFYHVTDCWFFVTLGQPNGNFSPLRISLTFLLAKHLNRQYIAKLIFTQKGCIFIIYITISQMGSTARSCRDQTSHCIRIIDCNGLSDQEFKFYNDKNINTKIGNLTFLKCNDIAQVMNLSLPRLCCVIFA